MTDRQLLKEAFEEFKVPQIEQDRLRAKYIRWKYRNRNKLLHELIYPAFAFTAAVLGIIYGTMYGIGWLLMKGMIAR